MLQMIEAAQIRQRRSRTWTLFIAVTRVYCLLILRAMSPQAIGTRLSVHSQYYLDTRFALTTNRNTSIVFRRPIVLARMPIVPLRDTTPRAVMKWSILGSYPKPKCVNCHFVTSLSWTHYMKMWGAGLQDWAILDSWLNSPKIEFCGALGRIYYQQNTSRYLQCKIVNTAFLRKYKELSQHWQKRTRKAI